MTPSAPTLFTVGTLDPLVDDTLFMAGRWNVAGNVGELAVYPGGVHAFNGLPLQLPIATAANDRIATFINGTLIEGT